MPAFQSALERRHLTVLMCDLVGFTAITERVDPEDLAEGMHLYRRLCAATIERHGGVVAQYVGDGILAYFGYPRSHEDDAERAVRAALALVTGEAERLPVLGDVRVHIGVATGTVVVGSASGGDTAAGDSIALPHHDVAAVGTAINLAARLQTLAPAGVALVADETRALTRGIFRFEDFGCHTHKGFAEAQQAWRVTRERSIRSRFSALRASTSTPLVGRREEMQRLWSLWEAARLGDGKGVLLLGDPGVGKSRLTEDFAADVDKAGGRCLWYSCSPHLQNSPLAPLIRHLMKAVGVNDGEDAGATLERIERFIQPRRHDGDEIVPLLAALLGVAYQPRYAAFRMSPQRQKARLFEVLIDLLQTLSAQRPILLVIEDLHWIDPSTDELIGTFIKRLKSLAVFAILTARPDFEGHWDDQAHVETIALSPLDSRDSVTMIEMICDRRDVSTETINAIAARADGLPLFIEDLTRDWLERSAPAGAEGRPRTDGPIPVTLTDALAARLDRLGTARRIAQIAATIGREFSYALLSRVCGLPEETLKEELQRLVASGLVVRNRTALASMYAFRHSLVRDAAYTSLLRKEQQALHARIATILADEFADTADAQPEVVAQHFEAAGLGERAVHQLVDAAKLASRRSGFAEALALLERAVRLLETIPASRARIECEVDVHVTLGDVNVRHRGFSAPECGVAYRQALECCRALGDAPQTCAVLSALGSVEITLAHFDACRRLAAECLALASTQSDDAPYIMGHRLIGGTLFLQGEFAQARSHLEEALARYERHPASHRDNNALFVQDHKSTALCYLSLTLTIMGDVEAGRQAGLAGLAHSRSLNDAHTINFSLCFLAAVCHIAGDDEAAWTYATESLSLAREQGFATWIGISQLIRGHAALRAGRKDEGFAEIMAGIGAHQNTSAVAYQPFGISIVVSALMAMGRIEQAAHAIDKALALVDSTGERFYLAELLRLKASLVSQAGDSVAGETLSALAAETATQQGAGLFEHRPK